MQQNRSARGRGTSKRNAISTVTSTDPVLARLEEAEILHQRATRRHDDSSLELFEAAALAFRDALSGRGGSNAAAAASSPSLAPAAADLCPLSPLKQASALFGLAEAFQGWASRLVERAEATPSDVLTRATEAQAAANATTLLAQAVGAFAAASGAAEQIAAAASAAADDNTAKATNTTAKHLLADAVVNAGNALCEWASLLSKAASWTVETRERFKFATSADDTAGGAAELLLQAATTPAEAAALDAALPQRRASLISSAKALVLRAVEAYEGAAALPDSDDADTRLNLADSLVQAGELAAEELSSSSSSSSSSSLEEARQFYLRAFKAFEEAVARASSEEGDDLPALLLNWGVALHSAFTKLHGDRESSSKGLSKNNDDSSSSLSSPVFLLKAAEARLRESASFGRGDPSPLCALGDVLCDRAALAAAGGGEAATTAAAASSAAAADEENTPRSLFERAISDGYGAALAIDRRCAAASAGKGDALLALSRLAADSSSDSSMELAREAARAFSNALSEAPRLGGLDERGSVIYNAACASARAATLSGEQLGGEKSVAGVETALEAARRRVRLLVAGGAVAAREVLRDDDLAFLREEQWLLDVASAEEAAETSDAAMW